MKPGDDEANIRTTQAAAQQSAWTYHADVPNGQNDLIAGWIEDTANGGIICDCVRASAGPLIAAAPALYDAAEKAADTFRDMGRAMAAIGRHNVAEACKIAEDYTRAALRAACADLEKE